MRIKDLLQETKLSGKPGNLQKGVSEELPGAFVQRELRNTDPYMQYRYGIAVATARAEKNGDVEFDQESPWAENLTQVMYVPEDEETIKLASKLMGVTPTKIADNKSHETRDVSTASPVAKSKRNKYGV